jgi:SAM-dependent methyltransferase
VANDERYGHALPGLEPVDRYSGQSRGQPIDRWYIHEFLWARRGDVRGRVLEVNDPGYTNYLGEGQVTRCDVVHPQPGNPLATFVGDLVTGEGIPTRAFDCVVLPQTLHLIYDKAAVVGVVRDALVPGGVVLATLTGIAPINPFDEEKWGEFWRFTAASARRLFADSFGEGNVELEVYGNVLVAAAFLYGYAAEDLTEAELAHRDDAYPFLIGVRAVAG